jgi:hypothetical protein
MRGRARSGRLYAFSGVELLRRLTRITGPLAIAMVALLPHAGATATDLPVLAGGDLQGALERARPGDTISLPPGEVFAGNFTLPAKTGEGVITLRTSPTGHGRPPAGGVRIDPANRSELAVLRSPNSQPVIRTAPGAHHWRLEHLELVGSGPGDLVDFGDGAQQQDQVPHDLAIDQCYIHGDPVAGLRRCVALNSASTTVANSYISDCKWIGEDAQAIAGWNGPGPFRIENNYLEGAGENLMFGGGDPSIQDLVPSDIVITGNVLAKPPAWRHERWQVKNILELKNARRVTIDGNTLAYDWQAAQSGFAVLFTVRNQDGRCPWCVVEDVAFTNNVVAHSGAGIQILGRDNNHPSGQAHGIAIRGNLFADINARVWGGSGYFLLMVDGPRDVTVDHNTIVQADGAGLIQLDGPPIEGFSFTNNIARHQAYGVIGTDHGPGRDSIAAFLPGARIARNVIADADGGRYPATNLFPPAEEFRREFVSFDAGDFRLVPASRWRRAGTDDADLGAPEPVLRRYNQMTPAPR